MEDRRLSQLSTAVTVCSPCKLYIAAVFVITHTITHGGIRTWVLTHRSRACCHQTRPLRPASWFWISEYNNVMDVTVCCNKTAKIDFFWNTATTCTSLCTVVGTLNEFLRTLFIANYYNFVDDAVQILVLLVVIIWWDDLTVPSHTAPYIVTHDCV